MFRGKGRRSDARDVTKSPDRNKKLGKDLTRRTPRGRKTATATVGGNTLRAARAIGSSKLIRNKKVGTKFTKRRNVRLTGRASSSGGKKTFCPGMEGYSSTHSWSCAMAAERGKRDVASQAG